MSFRIFLLLSLFIFSCSDDFLLRRASSDYFPLKEGMRWTYAVNGDSLWVEVVGDSNAFGHFVTVVLRNFIEEYWIKERGEVKKFFLFDTVIAGERETLEMGYKLYYKFPLVDKDTWSETKLDTVLIAGDSFQHRYYLKTFSSFVDTVLNYFDCYQIDFYQERELIKLSDTTERHRIFRSWVEFLAPEVGVVRREDGGRVEILTSFRK